MALGNVEAQLALGDCWVLLNFLLVHAGPLLNAIVLFPKKTVVCRSILGLGACLFGNLLRMLTQNAGESIVKGHGPRREPSIGDSAGLDAPMRQRQTLWRQHKVVPDIIKK